jgi:hypothetical protein
VSQKPPPTCSSVVSRRVVNQTPTGKMNLLRGLEGFWLFSDVVYGSFIHSTSDILCAFQF